MTTISAVRSVQVAVGVLTSNNTIMADGNTVTVGNKTYTFKTTLTPTEGEVLIAGSADAGLLNLIRAINHSGTPNTDYKCAAAHTQVTADAAVTSHTITVRKKVAGSIDTSEVADTLSWSTTTTVTTKVGDVLLVGEVTDETPVLPAQQVSVGERPAANPNWSRAIRASQAGVTVVRNGSSSVATWTNVVSAVAVALEQSLTWTPPVITTQPADATVEFGGSNHVDFVIVAGSELTLTYLWQESDDGTFADGHRTDLTTSGIYDVSVAGTLTITPTDATKDGYSYRCKVTDNATTPGTATSAIVTMEVTTPA